VRCFDSDFDCAVAPRNIPHCAEAIFAVPEMKITTSAQKYNVIFAFM
jgi:hypothetical protein